MKTGIIILNYNTFEETNRCIDSVRDKVKADYHIYLVDGHSENEEGQRLKKLYEDSADVTIILSDKNLGYSGGNNLGVFRAAEDGMDAMLIMNSDVVLENDIVSCMTPHLSENAVVLPHIVNGDGTNGQTLMKNFRVRYALASKTRLGRRLLQHIPALNIAMSVKDWDQPVRFMGMGSGCCFMIDAAVFSRIGCFDDKVFLYFEENILGLKLEKLNAWTFYEPAARVIHNHGAATEKASRAKKYLRFYRSEYYLLKEYCGMNLLTDIVMRKLILKEFSAKAAEDPERERYRKRLAESLYNISKTDNSNS